MSTFSISGNLTELERDLISVVLRGNFSEQILTILQDFKNSNISEQQKNDLLDSLKTSSELLEHQNERPLLVEYIHVMCEHAKTFNENV